MRSSLSLTRPNRFTGDKFDGTNEKDEFLEEYSAIVRDIAEERGISFVDVRHQMLKYLEENNEDNMSSSILTYDGIHMNEAGHLLLAVIFFKEMGYDSSSLRDNPILNPTLRMHRLHGKKSPTNQASSNGGQERGNDQTNSGKSQHR
jgi:hypothetical protein